MHDGTAYSLNDYTMTVDVTPVNDAPPTAADSTVVTNEDTTYTFALTDFNFSDVDGESLAQIQITGLESNGKLQLSGMDVALNDVIAAADISAGNLKFIPALDANGSPYDSFQFKVSDGTDYSVSTYTMTVDVTPVDDGPIAGTNTVVTDEDTTHIFSLPDFNFADITITTLTEITITGLESKGSLQLSGVDVAYSDVITKEEITAGQLKFIPALDANGSRHRRSWRSWKRCTCCRRAI